MADRLRIPPSPQHQQHQQRQSPHLHHHSRHSSRASNAPRSPISPSPTFSPRLRTTIFPLLNSISSVLKTPAHAFVSDHEITASITESLLRLRHLFIDDACLNEAKLIFRRLHGFQILIRFIAFLRDAYDPLAYDLTLQDRKLLLSLLSDTLEVIAEVLRESVANKRYYKRGEKTNRKILDNALRGICDKLDCDVYVTDPSAEFVETEQFFSSLLAAGLGESVLCDFLPRIRKRVEKATTSSADTSTTEEEGQPVSRSIVQTATKSIFGSSELVENPELLAPLVSLWLDLSGQDVRKYAIHRLAVPICLLELFKTSLRNRCALNSIGVLSSILPLIGSKPSVVPPAGSDPTAVAVPGHTFEELQVYRDLAKELCRDGIPRLSDAADIFRRAHTDLDTSEFLLDAVKNSKEPPCIQFDLSRHGFSCIELPCLGKQFPPTGSSSGGGVGAISGVSGLVDSSGGSGSEGLVGGGNHYGNAGTGYTLSLWVKFNTLDPDLHTTLFGAFDPDQECFILFYLERNTRKLVLQTSLSSRFSSVRFKSTVFVERKWYHIALVHKRNNKFPSSSRANLFVDGEFVEQLKAEYPYTPSPCSSPPTGKVAHPRIQCFFGTPEDLAPHIGKAASTLQWSLANAILFDQACNDDLIAVFCHLGPRYHGNFQDCLGSFQTYKASAALNLRNESLHPGTDEGSDIVTVIRQKAGTVISEGSVLINFSPMGVLADTVEEAKNIDTHDDENDIGESVLLKSLSTQASSNLAAILESAGNPVIINGAIPTINSALTVPHGTAMLMGDPVVSIPRSLDDISWRIGGCTAVHLSMVEAAVTPEMLVNAVQILFEAVVDNWRNSEAMEREHGYSVLAVLVSEKLGVSSSTAAVPAGPFSGPSAAMPSPSSPSPVCNRERSGSLFSHGNPPAGWSTQPLVFADQKEKTAFTYRLLTSILAFVGYDFSDPNKSCISNPLAYRVLIVDMEVWRMAERPILELYYEQFTTFAATSQYHQFNTRRLSRMRIVKKFIEALKGEPITTETLQLVLKAFKTIVIACVSAENLRVVALYITYAVHRPKPVTVGTPASGSGGGGSAGQGSGSVGQGLRSRKGSRLDIRSRRAGPLLICQAGGDVLTRTEIGREVLAVYADIVCDDYGSGTANIRRFSKAVTNKWLLYLISEDDPVVVVYAAKILARSLVMQGPGYVRKFADKNGGFVVMRERFKRWWYMPALWTICFSMLFGKDVAAVMKDMSMTSEAHIPSFVELFVGQAGFAKVEVVYPDALPILMAMLKSGLKATACRGPNDSDESGSDESDGLLKAHAQDTRPSSSSMSATFSCSPLRGVSPSQNEHILTSVVSFLSTLHARSPRFRDFTVGSAYIQELCFLLYPILVGSDTVSAELELTSHSSALTMGGNVVPSPSGLKLTTVDSSDALSGPRKSSSFIVLSERSRSIPAALSVDESKEGRETQSVPEEKVILSIFGLIQEIFTDQIISRKDFTGFHLFIRIPPGFVEHQRYFESWLLRGMLDHLRNVLLSSGEGALLCEPRVLTNLSRLLIQIKETVVDGSFIEGEIAVLEYVGPLLEYIQKPEIATQKTIRLCSQIISSMRAMLYSIVLMKLSKAEEELEALALLEKLTYWQTVLLAGGDDGREPNHLHLLCYQIYVKLVSSSQAVRSNAANFFRILLVQKPAEVHTLLNYASSSLQKRLTAGFRELVGMDDASFLEWVDNQRDDLDSFFFGTLSRAWESFVRDERAKSEDTAKVKLLKRREKLKQWVSIEMIEEEIIRRHDMTFEYWTTNISGCEVARYFRSLQDLQDHLTFMNSMVTRMLRELRRENGLLAEQMDIKWRLDQTEGRSRMRRRIIPDDTIGTQDYQPKHRNRSETKGSGKSDQPMRPRSSSNVGGDVPETPRSKSSNRSRCNSSATLEDQGASSHGGGGSSEDRSMEESFELIDDPLDDPSEFEDKNRKVMRTVRRGDQVQVIFNISRIMGLEACEGLLIVGKDHVYILDNFFYRSDGEIVNVWQATHEERDPYVRMISGRESDDRRANNGEHETRSWSWSDVVSVSKRRFLFRDVALEIFFNDGRSYLLTLMTSENRNDLYGYLLQRAPQISNSSNNHQGSEIWRFEALRSDDSTAQFFGSKFVSVFSQSSTHPATRKWIKGEMSNLHYLMLVNTFAGRTFNDLTQYPVFPWVLADYTSEELDLTNPKSFRDLTKPMGCQHPERAAEFRMRYQSFAEMEGEPPFHYGTHYSSAMIVSSYLIRLQPFVKSYLLMQGGTFDHADRMFYSIGKAWESASRSTMTDVRELTPEFFYLPDFLVNINNYDFGLRQNTAASIGGVELPPWAKGDPNIFIQKHREALESPYVSENLHHWIDLVFGFKQKGEAALEATNVFHHLSYQGAKDLDAIDDPVERLATIGIIHNFGQTPHQVFQKPHPAREELSHRNSRLDSSVEDLQRTPRTILDTGNRIASLVYSSKVDKLLCSGAFRLNIPPNYDRYMEWGHADGSVRFYVSDTKRLIGIVERVHIGQLTAAVFADSRTLITTGTDCTVSVWSLVTTAKSVDLSLRASLFGHRSPVTTLAVSRSFSAVMSASRDGHIMLWDLNRLDFVRSLPASGPVDSRFADNVRVYQCGTINDATGNIMICRKNRVSLFTLNGQLLLDQEVCEQTDDAVSSCAFYEGANNEWLERELLFTGHRKGVVNVWSKVVRGGKFELDLIQQLHNVDARRGKATAALCATESASAATAAPASTPPPAVVPAAITCILPMAQMVYTGDEIGRVQLLAK
ncbi:hypothetical protein KEM54_004847 [Ascosphaera aggregata]|nr:hypothetical protein KEM54_004847 [Ascosphaera aggregata]